jgi:hypothetical protein
VASSGGEDVDLGVGGYVSAVVKLRRAGGGGGRFSAGLVLGQQRVGDVDEVLVVSEPGGAGGSYDDGGVVGEPASGSSGGDHGEEVAVCGEQPGTEAADPAGYGVQPVGAGPGQGGDHQPRPLGRLPALVGSGVEGAVAGGEAALETAGGGGDGRVVVEVGDQVPGCGVPGE